MFSMLPFPAHSNTQMHYYTPAVSSPLSSSPLRSSPLSPRHTNVQSIRASPFKSQPIFQMSPTPTSSKQIRASPTPSATDSPASRDSVYSKRATKANPLIHGRTSSAGEDGRETRRKLFLKKVREDSQDKRWKDRGGDDEMMRSIWIAEQRRMEEKQRREAMGLILPAEEDIEEEFLNLDEAMADEVALNEERELEALLEYIDMPRVSDNSLATRTSNQEPHSALESMDPELPRLPLHDGQRFARTDTPYGSDDDEYDDIFMEVIQEEYRMSSQTASAPPSSAEDYEMMDVN